MDDRIKLAEAMGWTDFIGDAGLPPGARGQRPQTQGHQHPPDPFTDANDDYAVLEWMRNTVLEHRQTSPLGKVPAHLWEFFELINDAPRGDYKIGDYARAAISVLDRQSPK